MKLVNWLLILCLISCSGVNSEKDALNYSLEAPSEEALDIALEPSAPPPQNVASKERKKIIRESYLTFETSDMEKTYQNIANYIQISNGYIQSDQSNKNYNRINRTIVARIPSTNFQKVIDSISKDVLYFDTKNITATDITEEFIDITARLKAKRALENRYLELLNKAKNVKEILEIEKELSVIREEIESREGRLKYLENRVDYSTITIQFYKVSTNKGISISYGTKMWNAIKGGFNSLSIFFLGLLSIWPFLIFILLVLIIIRRKFFRKRKK
jgi:hypothetical protein